MEEAEAIAKQVEVMRRRRRDRDVTPKSSCRATFVIDGRVQQPLLTWTREERPYLVPWISRSCGSGKCTFIVVVFLPPIIVFVTMPSPRRESHILRIRACG